MARRPRKYNALQVVSCLVMLLALAWLTISLPYVYKAQQAAKQWHVAATAAADEDGGNPLSNATEEKPETGGNAISEYLNEHYNPEQHPLLVTRFYKGHPSGIYLAFHPEYVAPPPDACI